MWHLNRPPGDNPHGESVNEELIPDPRGTLTPSEIVEQKLADLLNRRVALSAIGSSATGRGVTEVRPNLDTVAGTEPAQHSTNTPTVERPSRP